MSDINTSKSNCVEIASENGKEAQMLESDLEKARSKELRESEHITIDNLEKKREKQHSRRSIRKNRRLSYVESSSDNYNDNVNVVFHHRRVELTPCGSQMRSTSLSINCPPQNTDVINCVNSKDTNNNNNNNQNTVVNMHLNKNNLAESYHSNLYEHNVKCSNAYQSKNRNSCNIFNGESQLLNKENNAEIIKESTFNETDQNDNSKIFVNQINEANRVRAVRMNTVCYISPERSNSSSCEQVNVVNSVKETNMTETNNAFKNVPREVVEADVHINTPAECKQDKHRQSNCEHYPHEHHRHHHHHHHSHSRPYRHHRHHNNPDYVKDKRNESNSHCRRRACSHVVPTHRHSRESVEQRYRHHMRKEGYDHEYEEPHELHSKISQEYEHVPYRTHSHTTRNNHIRYSSMSPTIHTHSNKDETGNKSNANANNNTTYTASNNQSRDSSNKSSNTKNIVNNNNNSYQNNMLRYVVIPSLPVQRGSVIVPTRRVSASINTSMTNAPAILLTSLNPNNINQVKSVLSARATQSVNFVHNITNNTNNNDNNSNNSISNVINGKTVCNTANSREMNSDATNSFITSATPVLVKMDEQVTTSNNALKANNNNSDAKANNNINVSREHSHISHSISELYSPLPHVHNEAQITKTGESRTNTSASTLNSDKLDSRSKNLNTNMHSEMEKRIADNRAWIEHMKQVLHKRHRVSAKHANRINNSSNSNNNITAEGEEPITWPEHESKKTKPFSAHSRNASKQGAISIHKINTITTEVASKTTPSTHKFVKLYTEIMFPSQSSSSSSESSLIVIQPPIEDESKQKGNNGKNVNITNDSNKLKKATILPTNVDVKTPCENKTIVECCATNLTETSDNSNVKVTKCCNDELTERNLQIHKQTSNQLSKDRKLDITPITVTLHEMHLHDADIEHSSLNSELNASDTDQLPKLTVNKQFLEQPQQEEEEEERKNIEIEEEVIEARKVANENVCTSQNVVTTNTSNAAPEKDKLANIDNITNILNFTEQTGETKSVSHAENDNSCGVSEEKPLQDKEKFQSRELAEKNNNNKRMENANYVNENDNDEIITLSENSVDNVNIIEDIVEKNINDKDEHETKEVEVVQEWNNLANKSFISFLNLQEFATTEALCDFNVNVAEMLTDEQLDALREVVFHHDEMYFAELLYADDIQSELNAILETLKSNNDDCENVLNNKKIEMREVYCNAIDVFNTRCKIAHDELLKIGEVLVNNIANFAKEYLSTN